jgi:hypothetical protein
MFEEYFNEHLSIQILKIFIQANFENKIFIRTFYQR